MPGAGLFSVTVSDEFREVGLAHVAGVGKRDVERECCREGGRCLAVGVELHVVAQQRTVHWVCAVLDNLVCALHGVLGSEVGDALVGDEDVDRVLRGVAVGHVRHDVADKAPLRDARAGED